MSVSFRRRLTSSASGVALVAVVAGATPVAAQDSALIPYQGQLADQSGSPVSPAEPITLVFRTYSEPTGGTASWEEAHQAVQVVGGRFSVLLGARQPFAAGVVRDFRGTVYLGVTVDDGQPETADIEMRPRQAIVPVMSARQALLAEQAERADWAQQAEIAERATVAAQLAEEASLVMQVGDLRAGLLALISYVGELRERIRDLEDVAASR